MISRVFLLPSVQILVEDVYYTQQKKGTSFAPLQKKMGKTLTKKSAFIPSLSLSLSLSLSSPTTHLLRTAQKRGRDEGRNILEEKERRDC